MLAGGGEEWNYYFNYVYVYKQFFFTPTSGQKGEKLMSSEAMFIHIERH